MARRYDARGNIYIVVAPEDLRRHGIDVPERASHAAQTREAWALAAIDACCGWAPGTQPPGSKDHRSDGLLVGPFQSSHPFDLLIVNTDGTLAERSGNGLTIFPRRSATLGSGRGTRRVCSGFTTTRPMLFHRARHR